MSHVDQQLFEALRSWRSHTAKAEAVPPYVIFNDRTLVEIAQARPTSHAGLEPISGFSKAKFARYGDAVLEIVRNSSEKRNAPP